MKDIVMTKWKKVDPGFLNSLRAAQDLISNAIHQNSDEDAVEHEGEGADDPEGDCTASHHAKLNQAALREIRDLEAKRALIEAMVDRITQQKAEMDKKNPASKKLGENDTELHPDPTPAERLFMDSFPEHIVKLHEKLTLDSFRRFIDLLSTPDGNPCITTQQQNSGNKRNSSRGRNCILCGAPGHDGGHCICKPARIGNGRSVNVGILRSRLRLRLKNQKRKIEQNLLKAKSVDGETDDSGSKNSSRLSDAPIEEILKYINNNDTETTGAPITDSNKTAKRTRQKLRKQEEKEERKVQEMKKEQERKTQEEKEKQDRERENRKKENEKQKQKVQEEQKKAVEVENTKRKEEQKKAEQIPKKKNEKQAKIDAVKKTDCTRGKNRTDHQDQRSNNVLEARNETVVSPKKPALMNEKQSDGGCEPESLRAGVEKGRKRMLNNGHAKTQSKEQGGCRRGVEAEIKKSVVPQNDDATWKKCASSRPATGSASINKSNLAGFKRRPGSSVMSAIKTGPNPGVMLPSKKRPDPRVTTPTPSQVLSSSRLGTNNKANEVAFKKSSELNCFSRSFKKGLNPNANSQSQPAPPITSQPSDKANEVASKKRPERNGATRFFKKGPDLNANSHFPAASFTPPRVVPDTKANEVASKNDSEPNVSTCPFKNRPDSFTIHSPSPGLTSAQPVQYGATSQNVSNSNTEKMQHPVMKNGACNDPCDQIISDATRIADPLSRSPVFTPSKLHHPGMASSKSDVLVLSQTKHDPLFKQPISPDLLHLPVDCIRQTGDGAEREDQGYYTPFSNSCPEYFSGGPRQWPLSPSDQWTLSPSSGNIHQLPLVNGSFERESPAVQAELSSQNTGFRMYQSAADNLAQHQLQFNPVISTPVTDILPLCDSVPDAKLCQPVVANGPAVETVGVPLNVYEQSFRTPLLYPSAEQSRFDFIPGNHRPDSNGYCPTDVSVEHPNVNVTNCVINGGLPPNFSTYTATQDFTSYDSLPRDEVDSGNSSVHSLEFVKSFNPLYSVVPNTAPPASTQNFLDFTSPPPHCVSSSMDTTNLQPKLFNSNFQRPTNHVNFSTNGFGFPCSTSPFKTVPTSGTVPESSRVRISGDAKRREVHNGFGAGWNSVADYESETRKLAAVAMADEIFLDQSRSIFKPRDQHFNGLVDVPNGCSPGHFPVNFKTGGPSCTETFAMANGYQNQPTFKRRDPFIAGAAVKQAEIHVGQNSMKQQDSRAIPAVATPTRIFPDQNSVNFAAGSFPNNAAFAVQGGNFPNQNPLVFMPGAHCATAAMEDGNYMDRNVINCKRTDSHIAAGTFTQNGSMDQNPVTVGTKDFQTPAASLMQDGNFQHQNPVTFKTRDPLISATNVLPGGNHVDWTATDIRATGQGKVAPAAKVKDNGSINTWKDLEDELDMIAMVDAILEEAKSTLWNQELKRMPHLAAVDLESSKPQNEPNAVFHFAPLV